MIRNAKFALLAAGMLLGSGCAEAPPTGENLPRFVTELDGLRLEVSLDTTVVQVGDSATITMQLHNDNPIATLISFSSGCQILPYIETRAGTIQYPTGGAWACTAALTSLLVPANGSVSRTLVVRGATSADERDGAALVRGQYRAYALLDARIGQQQLRSPTISFEIR